ncbi:hypothetical protein CRG98_019090 [Punica granatum]|uniref:TIR domain-containing protein n=1 Tax=Punica granatum TaxID=22663 RepID=A0A2I0JW77_PUNGR|nr:hypothetical protein CRG98_019090 [Punica granatum]
MDVSSCSSKIYDVFLSFRGPDVRKSFADCLYHGLEDAGILVFRDDEELPVGEPIHLKLVQAIQQSRISMPIFSSDYASSKSCLMEVQQMLECQVMGDHLILPIFFDIGPSVVKDQIGTFRNSFIKHERNGVDPETINMWKDALEKIGHLKGWDLQNFENGHVDDIREASKEISGLRRLQKQLVSKLLNKKLPKFDSLDDGVHFMRLKFSSKKVLILLDDLDDRKQLESLGKPNLYGPGSRIIVTTRKGDILKAVENYEVECMNGGQALQLFCKHAFHMETPQVGYYNLSCEIGTRNVIGLGLAFNDESKSLSPGDFNPLSNLRFLKLDQANIQGDFRNCLPTLRWLDWAGCSKMADLLNLHLDDVVILDLSYSQITRDTYSWTEIMKSTRKLKVLDLKACVNLSGCLQFPAPMTLKVLSLEDCLRLRQIDPSIRYLKELESLNLKMCCEVANLPSELSFMTCLKELLIDGTSLPDSVGGLESLSDIDLTNTRIDELPLSFKDLAKLKALKMEGCFLREFPDAIADLPNLKEALPDLPSSLVALYAGSNELKVVPNLSDLVNLKELHLRLDATGYSSRLPQDFEWVSRMPKLEALELSFPNHFELRLPENFAGLSQLRKLTLIYVDLQHLPQLPSRLSRLSLQNCRSLSSSPDLSNMHGLLELELEHCEVGEIRGLHHLEALQVLRVSYCTVQTLEALEELRHLRDLTIFHCSSLAKLPDLSHFEMLQEKDIEYWNW